MIKITEFKIEEAIIHILDLNCDEPILNERCLDLSGEDINIFLNKYVEKILKDDELTLGVFNDTPTFLTNINEFYDGKLNLIEVSKIISNNFFEIIKDISNHSSCDLLFLKLRTEVGYAICMIKLDYIKNYVHKIDYVEDKIQIDIVPQFVSFSGSVQGLNKGCLFLKDLNNDINVLYLNKYYKNFSKNSDYFTEDFLKCSKIYSDYSKTKDLISVSEKWTRKNIKDDADKAYLIRESLKDKLSNEENLNVDKFAREIFKDDTNSMESFLNFVDANGINGNFIVDKDYIYKKYERIRLKIDKDIDLYIDRDSFYDINRFEVKRNGDGSINMVIKYILNYNEK